MKTNYLNLAEHDICYVIFGASGDLAVRMLIPALQTISCYNPFSAKSKIIGVARTIYENNELEEKLEKGINQFSRKIANNNPSIVEKSTTQFLSCFKYINGQYDDPETYKALKKEIENGGVKFEGILIYMATPPSVVDIVAKGLYNGGIKQSAKQWLRIVCEKPFGYDLKTAIELNEKLHLYFKEDQIYRIDHYLAKETVTNIFSFRWGNTIWEPLWNRNYISHVEITVAETVDVGSRTGYYEQSSVIRDMIQNHLLQVLTITAMDPPTKMTADAIRDEKMKVLNAIRPLKYEDTILGQYIGYRNLEGVKKDSTTPTLGFLRIYIDNWRWQGVPFYICSGKCMKEKESIIKIVFKQVPHSIFGTETISKPNNLELRLQPNEGIILHQHIKVPGPGLKTQDIPIQFNYADKFGPNSLQGAYERVILDAVNGDQSFFTRADEIEQSWRIISPLLTEHHQVIPYAKGICIRSDHRYDEHIHKNYFPNIAELINGTTEMITKLIAETITKKGICRIAVTGSRTFRPIFALLATSPFVSRIDLKKLKIFFTTDICGIVNDHSIFNIIYDAFINLVNMPKENIFQVKTELGAKDAAEDYQKQVLNEFKDEMKTKSDKDEFNQPSFDLILLDIAEDGSTAGLCPGADAIHDEVNYVVASISNQTIPNVTFGVKLLNNAKNVMFVVDDSCKDSIVQLVSHAPYCPPLIPAQVVRPMHGCVNLNRLV